MNYTEKRKKKEKEINTPENKIKLEIHSRLQLQMVY
jgi:hypothetical protein